MLINIHTHNRTNKENQLEIVVGKDTIGIHPWDLHKDYDFSNTNNKCLMIGETGLDRSDQFKDTIELQKISLLFHFQLAEKFNLPIVIHCVRAHSDLLGILKKINFKGKILLHDFTGNITQINSYLKYDVYFSFRRNFEKIPMIPVSRIFLETDDQKDILLEDIYRLAQIPESQFEKNLLEFFSNSQDVSSSDIIYDFSLTKLAH